MPSLCRGDSKPNDVVIFVMATMGTVLSMIARLVGMPEVRTLDDGKGFSHGL